MGNVSADVSHGSMFLPIRFFMNTLQKKKSVESWGSALCREQRCPSKALWLGLFLNTFLNYIPEIFGS